MLSWLISVVGALTALNFAVSMTGAIAFVAFGRFGLGAQHENTGPTMALFVGGASVAELAVGLVLALLLYRDHHGLSPDVDTP